MDLEQEMRQPFDRRAASDVDHVLTELTSRCVELSGADNVLFRRNSQTGTVEAAPRTGSWGGLNAVLHAND